MTNAFKPGQSGNQGGRPRKDSFIIGEEELLSMRKLLTKHSKEAVKNVIDLMIEAKKNGDKEQLLKLSTWIVDKTIVVQRELERKRTPADKKGSDDEDETPKGGATLSLSVVQK